MENHEILVVDDDRISLKILAEHLEDLGYKTTSAMSGDEAWEILQQNPKRFSVIVLDRMMEGMDGLALLKQIKASEIFNQIPVVIQTGEAEAEDYISAIRAGAFDFIYKPIEQKLLMFVIKNAINKTFIEKQTSFEDV
jgi:CheY-like chemotaxis protein